MKLKIKYTNVRELVLKVLSSISTAFGKEEDQLTYSELVVLTELLMLPVKYKWARFSVPAKKYVLKTLEEHWKMEISSQNLNAKIYSITGKKFIWRDEDNVLYLVPMIERLAEYFTPNYSGEFKMEITFTDEDSKRNAS